MPASPPRFGAQARMHGLMTQLAPRHDLTAAILVDDEFDIEECRRAMQAYCREVVLVTNPMLRKASPSGCNRGKFPGAVLGFRTVRGG